MKTTKENKYGLLDLKKVKPKKKTTWVVRVWVGEDPFHCLLAPIELPREPKRQALAARLSGNNIGNDNH